MDDFPTRIIPSYLDENSAAVTVGSFTTRNKQLLFYDRYGKRFFFSFVTFPGLWSLGFTSPHRSTIMKFVSGALATLTVISTTRAERFNEIKVRVDLTVNQTTRPNAK
jgi:hypothetical protein